MSAHYLLARFYVKTCIHIEASTTNAFPNPTFYATYTYTCSLACSISFTYVNDFSMKTHFVLDVDVVDVIHMQY